MQRNRVKLLGTEAAYCMQIEGGVAEIRPETRGASEPMLLIEVEPDVWGEIVLGLTSLAEAHRTGRLETTGDPEDLAELSRALSTGLETSAPSSGSTQMGSARGHELRFEASADRNLSQKNRS